MPRTRLVMEIRLGTICVAEKSIENNEWFAAQIKKVKIDEKMIESVQFFCGPILFRFVQATIATMPVIKYGI